MKHISLKPVRYIFILLFLFQIQTSLGQDLPIDSLEDNIGLKKNLSATQHSIESLKQQALNTKNDVLYARTLRDMMLIRDQRTEDTLYFRNSAFIDSLLDRPVSAKLKALLHIMQAQRLLGFNLRYKRFNIGAYRTPNLPYNYAALSTRELDSVANLHIEEALKYHDHITDAQLLWLSSSQDVFLFAPRVEDIAITEQINYHAGEGLGKNNHLNWLTLSYQAFNQKLDSLQASDKKAQLVLYRRWMELHKNDASVSAFIQSLARKYIINLDGYDSVAQKNYVSYLEQSVTSPYALLKAHAVYQLCLIWNADGNKYFGWSGRYYYQQSDAIRPQYQYSCNKALQLYREHKELMEQYPMLNQVLATMETQITATKLRVEMDDKQRPGQPIAIRVMYRNTNTLNYRIVRVTAAEAALNTAEDFTKQMLKRPAVIDRKPGLPLPADYNKHAVYLKLDTLPTGHYRVLFSAADLKSADPEDIYSIPFEVTGIAAINAEERVFVLSRQTGKPLANAQVTSFSWKPLTALGNARKVGADGHIDIKNADTDSLRIVYKGDTTGISFSTYKNDFHDKERFNKDDFDDLQDFYDDKLRTEIFTDRAIYRPGQTVHYKIIFVTNNPKTGAAMLFNKANTGGLLEQWLDNSNSELTLEDPFHRKIDSATININEFGSFAGSFVIPKTAATGDWDFGGLPYARNNRGRFKVEEYKRPSIDLTMEKQQKKLLPGQPFSIKLKLRSFSGATPGNVPVKYTINRSGFVPDSKRSDMPGSYTNAELIATTGYTNEKGELEIPVADSLLAHANLPDSVAWNYQYRIEATATDATGESVDLNESISISSWPVKFNIPLERSYNRQKSMVLKISSTDDFEGATNHKVRIRLYRVNDPFANGSKVAEVDQWVYPVAEWNKWFPDRAQPYAAKSLHAQVLDTVVNVNGFENFVLPKSAVKTGFYEIVANVTENNRIVGQYKNTFNVFDTESTEAPQTDIDYLPYNSAKAGDVITWQSSGAMPRYTIYHIVYAKRDEAMGQKSVYQTMYEKAGISTWQYKIPADAVGQLVLTRISVHNGQIFNHSKTIYLSEETSPAPEIIVERYRKVMAPGSKETFSLSVKTQNDNVAAELLTTLYDATLDKLNKQDWQIPYPGATRYYNLNTRWPYSLTSKHLVGSENDDNRVVLREIGSKPGVKFNRQLLEGRVAGLEVTNSRGLNEVVVVGYGYQAKQSLGASASVITIRGTSSISKYNQPLIIVDGKVYSGELKSINPDLITQAMILKGADASAIYGSRAADGVLIISTKGPIVLPKAPEPEIKVRKNFNETAFFFPQVHADKNGFYTFSFTMPETATEWNWKMMAHTRGARFAYLDRKLQTQLNLMVQPNMPRLLYQGDRVNLQSRISNLDTLAIKGKVTCKIEDAVTGEDITAKLLGNSSKDFSLNAKNSGTVAFMLQVPAEQLNPLKIVISATSGSAADAEEHILPVLSPRVFVRQSQPVVFGAQPSLNITPVKLPADAALYGMSLSVNQKPQASLINALPWLANYSYDCAEQTFNKLRALAAALNLMQRDTLAQQAFRKAGQTIDQQKAKTEQLPDEMAETAMPWLAISNRTNDQQKKLFKLLDTSVTKTTIDAKLARLYKLQQADGGLAWFDGGKSSEYISSYVLAGFGQLKQLGWKPVPQKAGEFDEFLKSLVKYHEELLLTDPAKKRTNIYAIYATSAWLKNYPLSEAALKQVNAELQIYWKNSNNNQSLNEQALLITSTLRYTQPGTELNLKARKQLENISQLAITDAQNGMRWKEIADNEDLDFSAEEGMALLTEAFNQSGDYKSVQSGVVKWLLAARQDDHWQTTKATAAAIDLLQKERGTVLGADKGFSSEVSGQKLSVSDDLLNGTPVAFTPVKQQPQQVNLQQTGAAASGAITWYYFTSTGKLDTLNKTIKLKKQFFKYEDGKGWQQFTTATTLKPGDKVQVKLIIDAAARLTFVHISDPRAAAFEPKEISSGYQYQGELSYYQSIRDTGLELFAETIPQGISQITYELVVANSGEFTSGPAQLQCMYKPAVTAYSEAEQINVPVK